MNQPTHNYANFFQRFAARLIDIFIVSCIALFISISFYEDSERLSSIIGISVSLYYFLYYPLMEAKGGTIGKGVVSIKTLNLRTGNNITLSNSYLRTLFQIGPFLFYGIIMIGFYKYLPAAVIIGIQMVVPLLGTIYFILDLLYPFGTNKKQTLHDLWSQTIVIKEKSDQSMTQEK